MSYGRDLIVLVYNKKEDLQQKLRVQELIMTRLVEMVVFSTSSIVPVTPARQQLALLLSLARHKRSQSLLAFVRVFASSLSLF